MLNDEKGTATAYLISIHIKIKLALVRLLAYLYVFLFNKIKKLKNKLNLFGEILFCMCIFLFCISWDMFCKGNRVFSFN